MSEPGKRAKKKFVPIVEEAPPPLPAIHGRSASWNPANRFEKLHVDLGDADVVQIDPTSKEEEKPRPAVTETTKMCLSCCTVNDVDARFCKGCGYQMGNW